jgi:flagellin
MPQFINTNTLSLNAQRNLNSSQNSLATSLQRLSSGLRINSAKDDAAGLAIADRMTSQIRGLNQAVRNANDGISLAQTAEGALQESQNILQRMRELSIQSANGTNSTSDREALQAEVSQLQSELTRIADTTTFNNKKLFDGTFGSQTFQVGSNANETISVTVDAADAASLGSNTMTLNGASGVLGTGSTIAAAAGIAANGVLVEADLGITAGGGNATGISYAVNSSAKGIADAINTAAAGIGISATASNSATLSGFTNIASSGDTVTFDIGQLGSVSNISATLTSSNDLTALVSAINGVSSATGISASFTNIADKSNISLKSIDGRDIFIDNFVDTGTNGTASFNSTATGATAQTINNTNDGSLAVGVVELSSTKSFSTATANADAFAVAGVNNSAFTSVSGLDISGTDGSGAQAAINVIDAALRQISDQRGDLGAIQNRFSSTISNLGNISENVSAARSRIQDADFAMETAQLSRNQILQQAGIAMLSQANANPQNVLSLLQ